MLPNEGGEELTELQEQRAGISAIPREDNGVNFHCFSSIGW